MATRPVSRQADLPGPRIDATIPPLAEPERPVTSEPAKASLVTLKWVEWSNRHDRSGGARTLAAPGSDQPASLESQGW